MNVMMASNIYCAVNSTKRRKVKEKKRKLVKLSRVIVTHAFIDTIIRVFLQSDE